MNSKLEVIWYGGGSSYSSTMEIIKMKERKERTQVSLQATAKKAVSDLERKNPTVLTTIYYFPFVIISWSFI